MKNRSTLYSLAHKSEVGLTKYVLTLSVAHCAPAGLTAARVLAEQKSDIYDAARAAKRAAQVAVKAARVPVSEFISTTRNYFTALFGPSWNASWVQLGFDNNILQLPRTDAERRRILGKIKVYLAAHATQESTALGITALLAETKLDAFTAAQATVLACRIETRDKRVARDEAEAALEKMLRCLWGELGLILDPLDTRWLEFIDRIPGDPRVPEPVEDVEASAQPGGIIALDWEDTVRAAHYKVFKQVVGVDAEPVLALTVDDSDAQLTGVPSGATVKLQIVATNAVGDAPASEVIQLQAA